ncbi:protein of unknown function [Sphingomonas gellani]|uniref:DUF4440 domain-containing protein n=1 Tax=Sphingomonas gellani TaxID=1166340 RepID=A0A1H8B6X3_9SPHN|nr:nuclear transport factor 2 family protein [Sphingomonas gellani]SEM78720.1 protein of unknown function [Sphingomonas gellani]
MTILRVLAPLALVATAPAMAAPGDEAAVSRLTDAFVAAQRGFDQAALARLTAPGYVEISPLGDVDARDRMLGFYAPDKKRDSPPLILTERSVRLYGDTAVETARLAFGPAAMRATYVAHRQGREWVLISAQFTPIRTPRPS